MLGKLNKEVVIQPPLYLQEFTIIRCVKHVFDVIIVFDLI